MNTTTKSVISRSIRYHLDINNMEQQELANKIGVTPSAVNQWLKGKTTPSPETVDKICRAFGISRTDFVQDPDTIPADFTASKSIPLYNSIYHQKTYFDESNVDRYIAVDKSVNADFGIIVSSDSMTEADIKPGDIAFFTKNYNYVDGRIYAVWIMGQDSVILKKIYHNDSKFVLMSANPNTPLLFINDNEAFILGELVGIYKEWKW